MCLLDFASPYFKQNESNNSQGVLWQSFKQGDVEALEKIYIEYFDLLCLYGRQFSPDDPLLVEDCIQDLFIQLYTNSHKNKLADTNSIKFYLMKSLRRMICNAKKIVAKKNITFSGQVKDIPDTEPGLLECEIYDLNRENLLNQIQRLPARQREAIYLRFFSEMEFHEIADKMHLTVKSVYKLIYKAVDGLRHKYELEPV